MRIQQGRYSKVNLHEPSEEELLARALALTRPGDVFVDVGAAIGYYTILVAGARPEMRVYGFNPSEWFRKQMAGASPPPSTACHLGRFSPALRAVCLRAANIRMNFRGAGPPGKPICIETRALGLQDEQFAYINGEYGGRVNEVPVSRQHVDVSATVRDVTESKTVKLSTWLTETLGESGEVWMMMVDIQGTEGRVITAAKQDGTLAKGRVRQFFIGIHSDNNLQSIQRVRIPSSAQHLDVKTAWLAVQTFWLVLLVSAVLGWLKRRVLGRQDLTEAGYHILYAQAKVDKRPCNSHHLIAF